MLHLIEFVFSYCFLGLKEGKKKEKEYDDYIGYEESRNVF